MAELKGILLAGGKGTRLYPMTRVASKQLQPIYDKPMVYYPLTTMLLAGVRDVLIISSPEDTPRFQDLLGDGSQWGIRLSYQVQPEPRGIAQALVIGEDFIGENPVFLMLGDNLIYGRLDFLRTAVVELGDGATVFAYRVRNPSEFGVVEFDASYQVLSIEEKPKAPKSDWAVPGLYLYGPGAAKKAHQLAPSGRGEYEITDLNRLYLREGKLRAMPMGRGIAWLDTGTPQSLLEASNFVHSVETRQGLLVGSPEEAAYRMGWLTADGVRACLKDLPVGNDYRSYLERILAEAGQG
jgi:glucose-1-phosphate thymidylyltransferase